MHPTRSLSRSVAPRSTMADDRRRTTETTETTTTPMTTMSIASEAYDALSSYTLFLQRQNEALTRALQMSLASSSSSSSSSSSAGLAMSSEGRNTRRRSRAPAAARRPTKTYIAADPADFRLIVQQATGARRVPDEAMMRTETHWRSGVEPQLVDGGAASSWTQLHASDSGMHREGTSDVGDAASGNSGSNSSQPWFEFEPFLDFPKDGFM